MTEKIVINESLIDITVMWHNKCTLCIIIQTIKLHWKPQTEAQHTLATIHTYIYGYMIACKSMGICQIHTYML